MVDFLRPVRQLHPRGAAVLPRRAVFTYGYEDRGGTITQGGYSTHVVVDAGFALSVPEGIDPAAAAPLLCAGVITYNPLKHWGAGPGKRVAVVGLALRVIPEGAGPVKRCSRPVFVLPDAL